MEEVTEVDKSAVEKDSDTQDPAAEEYEGAPDDMWKNMPPLFRLVNPYDDDNVA